MLDDPRPKVAVYLGLGSNVGDRSASLASAVSCLRDDARHVDVVCGPVIESAAVAWPGVEPGGPYLNTVVGMRTSCTARELLRLCLAIERSLGRVRQADERWGPRTIDIDVLIFGESVIDEADLRIPHPRLHERRFVLEPLCAIAPELVVPGGTLRVRELLAALDAAASSRPQTSTGGAR